MKFNLSSDVVFGFSKKNDDNMKTIQTNDIGWQNIEKFCKGFADFNFSIIAMQQAHSNKIAVVGNNDTDKIIEHVDGLLTYSRNIFLIAKAADCLPIIIYSQNPKVVGIIHAGWKGTLLNISGEIVTLMQNEFGILKNDIFAIFGPSISSCCYDVKNDVFSQFQKSFNNDPQICHQYENRLAIDLRAANFKQLQNAGILKQNIHAPIYCTSCQNDQYFSYRKEAKNLAGEQVAVIALK